MLHYITLSLHITLYIHKPYTQTYNCTNIQSYKPAIIHYVTLHYIVLHCIALHHITLHCILFRYNAVHYITLHHIILHYIALETYPCMYVRTHVCRRSNKEIPQIEYPYKKTHP